MSVEISFIVIEYHSADEIQKCAERIEASAAGLTFEIIISSNSCYSEKEKKSIAEKIPRVRWIFNPKNKGFAYAMNRGIEPSTGEIVVLLNPDVRIRSELRQACDFLRRESGVGMIGPRMIDSMGMVQDSCRRFLTPARLIKRTLHRIFKKTEMLHEKEYDYHQRQNVDWLIGAFMMAKRDAINRVGLLDEKYFLYVEDMDWCKRFWDHGYRVVYFPHLEVEYKGTRKSTSPFFGRVVINRYTVYHIKGYLRFLKKYRMLCNQ